MYGLGFGFRAALGLGGSGAFFGVSWGFPCETVKSRMYHEKLSCKLKEIPEPFANRCIIVGSTQRNTVPEATRSAFGKEVQNGRIAYNVLGMGQGMRHLGSTWRHAAAKTLRI